jgi:SAM-dependent methyltransferase
VVSYNGLDSVPYGDRSRVLREVHRVLAPGGWFVVSGHNRHGPHHGERPRLDLPFTWNPVKLGWRTLRSAASLGRSWRNHRRLQALGESHPEWAVANAAAHDFGIVIVYASLAEQRRQLEAAGFAVERVYDNLHGDPLDGQDDTTTPGWFHVVARKR